MRDYSKQLELVSISAFCRWTLADRRRAKRLAGRYFGGAAKRRTAVLCRLIDKLGGCQASVAVELLDVAALHLVEAPRVPHHHHVARFLGRGLRVHEIGRAHV